MPWASATTSRPCRWGWRRHCLAQRRATWGGTSRPVLPSGTRARRGNAQFRPKFGWQRTLHVLPRGPHEATRHPQDGDDSKSGNAKGKKCKGTGKGASDGVNAVGDDAPAQPKGVTAGTESIWMLIAGICSFGEEVFVGALSRPAIKWNLQVGCTVAREFDSQARGSA